MARLSLSRSAISSATICSVSIERILTLWTGFATIHAECSRAATVSATFFRLRCGRFHRHNLGVGRLWGSFRETDGLMPKTDQDREGRIFLEASVRETEPALIEDRAS